MMDATGNTAIRHEHGKEGNEGNREKEGKERGGGTAPIRSRRTKSVPKFGPTIGALSRAHGEPNVLLTGEQEPGEMPINGTVSLRPSTGLRIEMGAVDVDRGTTLCTAQMDVRRHLGEPVAGANDHLTNAKDLPHPFNKGPLLLLGRKTPSFLRDSVGQVES